MDNSILTHWRVGINKHAPTLILYLCLISILLISVKPNITSKIFNLAGFISILIVVCSPRYYLNNKVILLSIPLFIIGLSNLMWVELYKTSDTIYRGVYHGYAQMGKIAILGCFILPVITQCKNSINLYKIHIAIASLIPITILIYTLYQVLSQGLSRVELAFGGSSNATGAAYAMIFLSLYTQAVFLYSSIKLRYYLYGFFTIITLFCVILTQTRSGIILYPILTLFLLALYLHENNKLRLKYLSLPILVILISFFLFKESITNRMNAANNEFHAYMNENKSSSVGARLSMLKAGYIVAKSNLFWQSAEERNSKITILSKDDMSFSGAAAFMDAHLHNDIIESLSTKGWLGGVLITLLLYIMILLYAIYSNVKSILLTFCLCLVSLGLSDSLIYATQIPLAWVLSLFLIINYSKIKPKDK